MERGQFTFYASFYKAIRRIRNKAARADAYDAICAYALDGTEPDMEKLSDAAAIAFEIAQPILEAGRRKAESGGIKTKKDEIKIENDEIKTEKSGSKGKDKDKEKEKDKVKDKHNSEDPHGTAFEEFWSCYPKQVGKEQARKAFALVREPVSVLLEAIAQQKQSAQWTKDGGAFIPNPATWLRQQRWEDRLPYAGGVPKGASGYLGEAEKENIRRLLAEECPES